MCEVVSCKLNSDAQKQAVLRLGLQKISPSLEKYFSLVREIFFLREAVFYILLNVNKKDLPTYRHHSQMLICKGLEAW